MRRAVALVLGIALAFAPGMIPANSAECSASDTEKVRALFVPVLRVSAYQGRNLEENHDLVSDVRKVASGTNSSKLRRSLDSLEKVIQKGELSPGSTFYWGYKDGSAWKTFKQSLAMTQKNRC